MFLHIIEVVHPLLEMGKTSILTHFKRIYCVYLTPFLKWCSNFIAEIKLVFCKFALQKKVSKVYFRVCCHSIQQILSRCVKVVEVI